MVNPVVDGNKNNGANKSLNKFQDFTVGLGNQSNLFVRAGVLITIRLTAKFVLKSGALSASGIILYFYYLPRRSRVTLQLATG